MIVKLHRSCWSLYFAPFMHSYRLYMYPQLPVVSIGSAYYECILHQCIIEQKLIYMQPLAESIMQMYAPICQNSLYSCTHNLLMLAMPLPLAHTYTVPLP